jgi:hypothetical protein
MEDKPLDAPMMAPNEPEANGALITCYLSTWQKLEKYRLQEDSLRLLFSELCPENKKIEHVLLKVCALNAFYSTNIFDTYSVAKHILEKDIDPRLSSGDCSLVNEIAKVTIKDKEKNFYSFASKYCSHHEPNKFPIFDYFVEKLLIEHQKRDCFDDFRKGDLKEYKRFVEIIENFKQAYGLQAFTLRDIDIYLWIAGKETFKRYY